MAGRIAELGAVEVKGQAAQGRCRVRIGRGRPCKRIGAAPVMTATRAALKGIINAHPIYRTTDINDGRLQ